MVNGSVLTLIPAFINEDDMIDLVAWVESDGGQSIMWYKNDGSGDGIHFSEASVVVPIYKGKGDVMKCGSYRGVKLLEHGMKVVERVLERRIRNCVVVDEMQFGFMPGKGTVDALFVLRRLQEEYLCKEKKLYNYVFCRFGEGV